MSLTIDRTQTATALDDDAFRAWASAHTVFISSEMRQLKAERRGLADRLRSLGLNVIMFEDLGGRDDDPETAYLDGVARSDIYLGLIGARYGRMLPSGRSPTHEEYREARRLGLRIAVWADAEDANRQGDARDFLAEIQTFHSTGGFTDADELAQSVEGRLREIAAEQDRPWVILDETIFRANSIDDDGTHLAIVLATRDRDIASNLEALRPGEYARATGPVAVSYGHTAGAARVSGITSRSASASLREMTIEADVTWADGRHPPLAATINGVSYEEQVVAGLKAGLFSSPLPDQLGLLAGVVDASDPLAALDGPRLPHGIYEQVARLLITSRLVQSGATAVEVAVGPVRAGRRRVAVEWTDARRYAEEEPVRREIEGERGAIV